MYTYFLRHRVLALLLLSFVTLWLSTSGSWTTGTPLASCPSPDATQSWLRTGNSVGRLTATNAAACSRCLLRSLLMLNLLLPTTGVGPFLHPRNRQKNLWSLTREDSTPLYFRIFPATTLRRYVVASISRRYTHTSMQEWEITRFKHDSAWAPSLHTYIIAQAASWFFLNNKISI